MSEFQTSLDEYTKEEKDQNGNMMYGGKRHDEICDHLQNSYKFNDSQMNDISMGVWLAIESERRVQELKIDQSRHTLEDCQNWPCPSYCKETKSCISKINPLKCMRFLTDQMRDVYFSERREIDKIKDEIVKAQERCKELEQDIEARDYAKREE